MLNELISESKLEKWHFGRYVDEKRQRGYLLIKYISKGKRAPRPLELPHSDHAYPKQVMKKLLDAGADINPVKDFETLSDRLGSLNVTNGLYLQKAGVHDGFFVLGDKMYGSKKQDVILDGLLLELSGKRTGKSGTLTDWQRKIAEPAEYSSFIMFGIALSLCAPIYEEILSEEGVVFNLAGTSGLGKTTVIQGAQSVIGSTANLMTWNGTPRGICEALAASSDTLFIIDDFEKIDSPAPVSKVLRTQTHSITEGTSKAYSNTVRGNLPDYTWSCPVLTSGPWTVEKQASLDNFKRTNGDRRRMIDIPIDVNDGIGIWDKLPKSEDPGEYAHNFRIAAKTNFGTLFPRWLKLIYQNHNEFIEDIRELVEKYAEKNRIAGDVGFEQMITRKFGIVYAAGKRAIDENLLFWDVDGFEQAIVKLHHLARNSIRSDAQITNAAILSLNHATEDTERFAYVKRTSQAKFSSAANVTGLVCETHSQRSLYITLSTLDGIVGGKVTSELLISRMKQIGAYIPGSKGRTCCQTEVIIGTKKQRPRMLHLDLDAFDKEVERLTP